ncbi:hypothetical protein MBLNU459_g5251t1 [Dothideomycetes sp. NU459]
MPDSGSQLTRTADPAAKKSLRQAVEDAGYADFGFLVIRTSYEDESLFDQWAEEFSNLVEKSITESADADGLIDKLMLTMIVDEQLQGASWEGIQEFVDEARDDNMVPPGLDVGFGLAVDQEVMRSLIHPKSGEEPWVWAVDTDYEFTETSGRDATDTYPGYFKVALTSVMTEFYAAIASPDVNVAGLWSLAKPIWKRPG